MGVVILGGLLLLLVVVRNTLKMADAKAKLADELSSRFDDWYIKTGTVSAYDNALPFPGPWAVITWFG